MKMDGSSPHATMLDTASEVVGKRRKRATKQISAKALLLVLPLVAFLLVFFVTPIAEMLYRSIDNRAVAETMQRTHVALANWNRKVLPDEKACLALVADLRESRQKDTLGAIGRELGYEYSSINRLLLKTARRVDVGASLCMEQLAKVDPEWENLAVWETLKDRTGALTNTHLLASFDLHQNAQGEVVQKPEEQRIYVELYKRTLYVGVAVTLIVLIMGFPLAHLLANASGRRANVLMMCILLPFWTSLLVRSTSWIVLLQRDGPLLDLLAWLHLIDGHNRPQLVYTLFASLVAISHILLPIMVLSLYSVMKSIPKDFVRASLSLGASPLRTFWSVYIPQVAPGIATGSVLVFISSLGIYITPALVGGSSGQVIGNMIAYHMQRSLNWGLAASLSGVLLITVCVVLFMLNRVVGLEKMGAAK
jgi:putative spermidine/putrescine transport system permease protein